MARKGRPKQRRLPARRERVLSVPRPRLLAQRGGTIYWVDRSLHDGGGEGKDFAETWRANARGIRLAAGPLGVLTFLAPASNLRGGEQPCQR
jgi:hypothetical protein